MGSLFSGGSKTTTQKADPFQGEYLNYLFDEAKKNYQTQQEQDLPQQQYAGLNQDQLAAIDLARNFVNGQGSSLVSQTGDAANLGLSAMAPYIANAQNAAAGNFNVASGASPDMVNAYNNAAQNALGTGAAYGSNAQSLFDAASQDPTQANVNAASQYINNDILNGQIDAANRDVARMLNESTLPSLNMAASAGGNLNSSRAGAAEAQATRAASDQMADNAAQIRGAAYNNGLNLAEQARTANLNAANSANSQLGNYANMGFSNLFNGMNFGEGQRQFDINAMQQANSQLGQAAGMGNETAANSNSLAGSLYQLLANAGATQQQDQQGQYTTDYANQMADYTKTSNDLSVLKSLLNGNYGNNVTTTQKGGTNAFGQILGTVASAVAAYYTGGASLAAEAAMKNNQSSGSGGQPMDSSTYAAFNGTNGFGY